MDDKLVCRLTLQLPQRFVHTDRKPLPYQLREDDSLEIEDDRSSSF